MRADNSSVSFEGSVDLFGKVREEHSQERGAVKNPQAGGAVPWRDFNGCGHSAGQE